MHLVRVSEILDQKSGKKKKELEDGSIKYIPWLWTKFKGETTIDGEPQELTISTFSHVEPDKLYEGELKQEDYKGNLTWKFDSKGEFETTKQEEKPSPSSSITSKQAQALPSTYRETALKCALIYYEKANKSVSTSDITQTAQVFYEWLIE